MSTVASGVPVHEEPAKTLMATPGTRPSMGTASTNAGSAASSPQSNLITIAALPASGSANNNFGERLGSLAGNVFLDRNNDGLRTGAPNADPGIAGVSVTLTGTDASGAVVNRTTTTDANGAYRFDDLLAAGPAGYTVTEQLAQPLVAGRNTRNGLTRAGSVGGVATAVLTVPSAVSAIALPAGVDATEYNFGERLPSSISGTVFVDRDNNGLRAANEPGLPGITVVLTGTDEAGNPVVKSTSTDADGRYRFDDLLPGTYAVTEPDQPAETSNGQTRAGSVDGGTVGVATAVASVPSAITQIALPAGRDSIDNNFGELPILPNLPNSPDLVVSKAANEAIFTVGRPGSYTLKVRNIGQAPSSGAITLSDRLPAGLTLSATPSGTGWTCSGAVGASSFSCVSSQIIAAGAEASSPILARVNVAAASGAVAGNRVLVEGGGEAEARQPTAAEREAFNGPGDGSGNALPLCTPLASANTCQSNTAVQLTAAISGTVWYDIGPKASLLDSADKRLPGWIVELIDVASGQIVATTRTGADGSYRIADLMPGVPYAVRFRDPQTGVVYGYPVNGETAPGSSGAACNANAVPSSCVQRGSSPQLGVVLAAGQELTQQSLPVDPSGVVYDAVTRLPVAGAVVTLTPVGSCPGWSPAQQVASATLGGYTIAGNAISMTTGANGAYQWLLLPTAPASCDFALTVAPPAGYSFVSQIIAPAGNTLRPVGNPGTVVAVQPQATAPTAAVGTGTLYYLNLGVGSGTADVVHNHIPLDPALPAGLSLRKTADRPVVEVGSTLRYSITVTLSSGSAPRHITVIDRLPPGFTYVAGSASVDGRSVLDPGGNPGPLLAFELGAMPASRSLTLHYRVRADVGSLHGDGVNRATGVGCLSGPSCERPGTATPLPGSSSSNEGRHQVRVAGGVFGTEACVMGKVFVDCNGNQVQDPEELGIPGVRLVLQDGTFLISDSEGKYSACGLPPKSHVLRIDGLTLPRGARLVTSSNRNLGDAGSLWLDLKNGELQRADFIEGSCSNSVLDQVKARRAQGEVRAPENEKIGQPALRFDSKAHGLTPNGTPQQGTDSANQRVPKPRDAADNLSKEAGHGTR